MGKRPTLTGGRLLIPIAILFLALLSTATFRQAGAATTITAYQARTPVTINGVLSAGEWSDTPIINISQAEMGVAFKHNSTGLFVLMQWQTSPSDCDDQNCFGGLEFGYLNNTGPMGATATPTVMLLLSPSFSGGYDEFVSKAETTPTSVESDGYKTQSTCALKLSGSTYTAECYRPFTLTDASPVDPFPSLASGSPIEVGFAVGEFNLPGVHAASDMSTYVLVLSNQTYTATTTSSSPSAIVSSLTSSSSSSTTAPSPPSAAIYGEELAVIVVGFSVLILLAMTKYRRG